jgi:type IV secretory pathway VirB2 component (pilin)
MDGMEERAADALREARRAARWLAQLDLALLAAGFAWFAYIDAPISDGAMWLIAGSVAAGLAAVAAALMGWETAAGASGTRWRRAAQLLFLAALALMLAAATATLNLKGTGNADADTQTVAATHA